MAASKKKKLVKQTLTPQEKRIVQGGNPDEYYAENPAWSFSTCDMEMWAFTETHIGNKIWQELFPRLIALESQTWSEILITSKKQNHSIEIQNLNKIAQRRLAELYIEAEAIISLRITGNHRLYGYMTGRVFNVLWYDDNHGNNSSCVCRSNLKHT